MTAGGRFAATAGKPASHHQTIRGRGVAKRRRLPGEAHLGEDGLDAALFFSLADPQVTLLEPGSLTGYD
jgi:hypothetical protein